MLGGGLDHPCSAAWIGSAEILHSLLLKRPRSQFSDLPGECRRADPVRPQVDETLTQEGQPEQAADPDRNHQPAAGKCEVQVGLGMLISFLTFGRPRGRRSLTSRRDASILGHNESGTNPGQGKAQEEAQQKLSLGNTNHFFTSCNLVLAAFASTESG